MSCFVAGAIFGDDGMSLFVAGATCGEYWAIAGMRSVAFLQSIKMRPQSATSKLGERTGCGCPFHSRIMLGTVSEQLSIGRSDSRILGFMLEARISWHGAIIW